MKFVLFFWAVLLALLSCCVTIRAAENRCTFNDRPESLPLTLDSISYLGLNKELHFHGEYYVNFTESSRSMNFTLTEESAFRIYVAPHAAWDIDLYLYDNSQPASLEHSSLDIFTEEVIQTTLPAGSYRVNFNFLSGELFRPGSDTSNSGHDRCETLVMELSIIPKTRVLARTSQYPCPDKEEFPSFTVSVNEETGYKYENTANWNANTTTASPSSIDKHKVARFLKSYDFTLPLVKGSNGLWRVEAVLGSDFLTAGSLGILLDLNGTSVEKNLDCARPLISEDFPECIMGTRGRINEVVLRWVLQSDVKHTLWLFDRYGESDRSLRRCAPFTFSLKIEPIIPPENILSCNAPFIPATLNTPDLLGDRGYLHYMENVFVDLRNIEHNINFSLKTKSAFRVFTEEHRVDVDLRLKKAGTTEVIAYSLQFNRRETIVMELDAGDYVLNIKYFGTYSVVFCETFFLEIAIAPLSYLPIGLCADTPAPKEVPDLTGLAAPGVTNYSVAFTTFRKAVSVQTARQRIFSYVFETTDTSQLHVLVGRDFLLGDLELTLTKGGEKWVGLHRRNLIVFNQELLAGQYNLTLTTSGLQGQAPALPDFPPCVTYTFQLDWMKVDTRARTCWGEVSIVDALKSAFVSKPKEIHLTGSYLIPSSTGSILTSQEVTFSVPVRSQIRLYSEPHEIDVDFHLLQGNLDLASATASSNEEEELVFVLQPNTRYTLLVQYFNMHVAQGNCPTFDMEFAISPVPSPIVCLGPSLPPDNFIPSPPRPQSGQDIFVVQGSYVFSGANDTFSKKWTFTLDDTYFIRAVITYDFVWSNLNVRVVTPAAQGEKPEDFAIGELAYNRNEMPLTELPPGTYSLEVYEPLGAPASSNPTSRCVPFSLVVAFAAMRGDAAVAQNNSAYAGCHDYALPTTLNNLAGISVFSNKSVHFARHALADVAAKSEYVDFRLDVPSVFRVLIPRHSRLDIDIILFAGTAANHPAPAILSRVGFNEEAMLKKLAPGNYTLKFMYYGLDHQPLPNPLDCVAFPLELGITPLSELEAIPSLASQCDDALPPQILQPALPFNKAFAFKHRPKFNHTMTFTSTQAGSFSFHLRYEFVSSGLYMELKGQITEGVSTRSKSYYGRIGTNHAFMNEVLQPGNYTLTISDPTSWENSDLTTLPCGRFEVSYLLLTGTSDVPGNSCDESESLPTDLYSATGGSAGFGGPQKTDGSIRVYGNKFVTPRRAGQHHFVRFRVPRDSFFRIFSVVPAKNDIDFYIYKNTNRTFSSLVNYTNGFDRKESGLFLLKSQRDDYLLDMSFFSVDTSKPCNYFQLLMAMKPITQVYNELACPILLPIGLTTSITLSSQSLVDLQGHYVFTKAQVDNAATGNKFRYRIHLDVLDNTLLYVDIGFDFLANDFHLTLANEQNEVKFSGEPHGEEQADDSLDFHNTLIATLEPGRYFLDINEDLMKKDLRLNGSQCHRFSFALSGFSESTPRVLLVSPDQESIHSPYDDLLISITMSDPIIYPQADQLSLLVTNNHWIYLKTDAADRPHGGEPSPSTTIPPDMISYASGNTVIRMKWLASTLTTGKTYELVFNLTSFTTTGQKHFANAVQRGHFYTVMTDDCNNHGHVNTSITDQMVCICDPPYAGEDCTSCMPGYHGVGDNCVPDIPCTPHICNDHGTCSSAAGYPECRCNPGYATVGTSFCSVCASGYQGYPKCEPIPEQLDESTRCKANILPLSLDGMAYLGFDGEARLQGHFFIDPVKKEHTTTFTLKEDSVFRMYLAPHWVDVDIFLYKVTGGKEISIANGGLGISVEESIYMVLNKSVGDDHYLVRWRYYIFSTSRPDCESINMALSIVPLTRSLARASKQQETCSRILTQTSGSLPLVNTPVIRINAGEDYNYGAAGPLFAIDGINAPGTSKQNSLFAPEGNFFWNVTLVVPSPPEGQVIVLHAEVGSSFTEDNTVLLLEPGNDKTHCSPLSGSTKSAACIAGVADYNKNVLDTILGAGNYTLWLSQPRAPLTNCSLFEFSLSVTFEYSWGDTFSCKGARFPHSLNEPNYLDQGGTLHFQDDFLLEESFQVVNFTLHTASFFKMAVTAELVLSFDLFLFDARVHPSTLLSHSTDGLLSQRLEPGNYMFEILVFDQLLGNDCPAVNVELAIIPTTSLAAIPSYCSGDVETLPTLPASLGSAPYVFNSSAAGHYKTFKVGVVAAYPIVVTEPLWLHVEIVSEFIRSDVRAELHIDSANPVPESTVSPRTVKAIGNGRANQASDHRYGTHEYNLNKLDWVLSPGSYSLKITRPALTGPNSPLAPCAAFDFALQLKQLTDEWCEGEELPSFSSLRFLYSSNNINFQSTKVKVPEGRFPSHFIYFEVQDTSLFRVYTEPHVIDIDLHLWHKNKDTNQYTEPVASSKNGFYDEEVLVAFLERDKAYALELSFFKWNLNSIPPCPVFSMGFAITQNATLPPATPCPLNGTEFWPPEFPANLPTKPYFYDSTVPLTSGGDAPIHYFQQAMTGARSKTYSFSLDDTTDMYLEVGYDFALGDLVLKLTNTISGEEIYGSNEYNRNYISAMNLVPSKYTLTIYEPETEDDPGIRKCAYFTFRAMIVKGGLAHLDNPQEPPLPDSLDTLPYLGYNQGVVHLQGRYSIFRPGIKESHIVGFTLKENSEFRVAVASESEGSSVGASLKKKGDSSALATGQNIYKSLAPGTYELTFLYRSLSEVYDLEDVFAVPIELAIRPRQQLEAILYRFATGYDHCHPLLGSISAVNISDQSPYYSTRGEYTIDGRPLTRGMFLLGEIPLNLQKETLVYAKLGFNFLFDDLYLRLKGKGVPDSLFPHDGVLGTHARNQDLLNQLVPAGQYTLTVGVEPPQSELWHGKDLCMPYSMGLFLQEAKANHEHLDCIEYDLLPWDLDTYTGGSGPFGGPIVGGSVHISGQKFLLFKKSTNTIVFTTNQKSVLSLFFSERSVATRSPLSFRLTDKGPNGKSASVLEPIHANSTYGQRVETYVIEPYGRNTHYEIQLLKDPNAVFSGTCTYFAFDLVLEPIDTVIRHLMCPDDKTSLLPAKTLTLDERGVGFQHLQAVLKKDVLDTQTNGGVFQHTISIQVKKPSSLAVSVSFSSLSNFLMLTMSRASHSLWPPVGRSSFSPTTGRDRTNLVQRLIGNLSPDNYTLTLSQPAFAAEPFRAVPGRCYPYIWELQVIPRDIPYVAYILPEGGEDFNSFSDLVLRISFSEAPYNGSVAVTSENAALIIGAFSLTSGSTTIKPSKAEPAGSDNTIWTLTFAKGQFREGETYTLNMKANALVNSKGAAIIFTNTRTYTMLPNGCTGHGVWQKEAAQCKCVKGYDGPNCEQCAANYVATKPAPELGCTLDTSKICTPNICGCVNPGGAVCQPLGTCSVVQDKAFCNCNASYSGDHCESCAAGLVGYPLCKLPDQCTPHCVHGECDLTSKTCKCDEKWQGSADCSLCSKGWTGSDCNTPIKPVDVGPSGFVKFLTVMGILLAVFIVLGIIAWIAWFQYKKFSRKRRASYFPVGLEELEDAMELQSSNTFRGDGDDEEEEKEEKEEEEEYRKKSSGAAAKRVALVDVSDDESPVSAPAKPAASAPGHVDNDFNPRARDAKKDGDDLPL